MMEDIIINPKNYTDQYLYNLNRCFDNWGGQREYDWVFNRITGKKAADIILIKNKENQAIAGSAITYRKLKIKDQRIIDIGIMTGSWTLPEARGKGCFSKIIEVSREICMQNHVPLLAAFVMENNPSYRRLKHAGSALIPTHHFISQKETQTGQTSICIAKNPEETGRDIYHRLKQIQEGYIHFEYTYDNFHQQYIERTRKTELLEIGEEYAVIEESQDIIKVLVLTFGSEPNYEFMVTELARWGLKTKAKPLLLYTSRNKMVKVLSKLGYKGLQGSFTLLNTTGELKDLTGFSEGVGLNLGDKM